MARRMERATRRALLALCLCIALLAGVVRETCDLRHAREPGNESASWFTLDPDSLYHMRRVERALDEGLPPAETDPRMNAPHGAAIPWPPYYTWLLTFVTAPMLPDTPRHDDGSWAAQIFEARRREAIERTVASVPWVLAMVTSVLLALSAWRLAKGRSDGERLGAAALAGGTYALLGASLQYSAIGNGDHHAWVVMLLAALVFVATSALREDELLQRGKSAWRGTLLGALSALLVGSWVGGLVYVVLLELALGLALFVHARRALPGLPALGLGFHLVWAAGITPAVLSSPWREVEPWMLVNLSWLHLVHPLVGALVFVPLVATSSDPLRRRWPWRVSMALTLLLVAIAFGDFALARGVREGFAWAGRANEFMAFIAESQPLLWGPLGGLRSLVGLLGFGVCVAPLLFAGEVWRAWREQRLELLLPCLLFGALLAQALMQRRFADAFGVPLALVLGLGLTSVVWRVVKPTTGLASALGLVLAFASGYPTLSLALTRRDRPWFETKGDAARPLHALYGRLGKLQGRDEAVLASWDHGHAIEWIGQRPSIATNFGSYLGRDSYLDPWRFFLESDATQAEALLEARGARHVLICGDFTKDLEVMLRLLAPDDRRSYLLIPREGVVFPSQRFFDTLAGRLLVHGRTASLSARGLTGNSLDFLRLVHASPEFLSAPPPIPHTSDPVRVGWIWERVPGARVELAGEPGARAQVSIELSCNGERWTWLGSATVEADGFARLRVPYSTDGANGDTLAAGPARGFVGTRSVEFVVREDDVLAGATVRVP
ncbi:MAG: hypothetical protein HUU28_01390 [Planctomycetaceae bacterium]|nr:hypothetical protein [Planctomycetaceae bacterium]